MKRQTVVLWSGAALFLLAWFLPVVAGGTTLAQGGIPGWEAFRLALSPVWPHQALGSGGGVLDVLSVVSAMTNLGFVIVLTSLAAGGTRFRRSALWSAAFCAAVNTFWLVLTDLRGDLRIGYYTWLAAFVVLAGAAYLRRNGRNRVPASPVAV